ncbi:TIM barrel protein [Fretibacter rubidus]|uniref:TIM barrel protein n=1 Tax=Fretibacter rubidus TaxID=570162 RepID=UPI00352BB75F
MVSRRDVFIGSAAAAGLAACAAPSNASLNLNDKRALLSGFAVNTESWWTDEPFERRFVKAAEAGFTHAEFWFVGLFKRDAKALAAAIKPTAIKIAQIVANAPALGQAANRVQYLDAVKQAIDDAKILGTDIVTVTGHQNIDGVTRGDVLKAYRDNIAASAELWEAAQIYCAIEPFNPYDHPGHFIYGYADALDICASIKSPFIKLNWDLFHMQRHEGNLIANFEAGKEHVAYVQIADSPARGQPGTGEVDYANVLRKLRETYTGPIGLEFWAKDKDYDQAVADMVELAQRL